jgi:hypothetical protein
MTRSSPRVRSIPLNPGITGPALLSIIPTALAYLGGGIFFALLVAPASLAVVASVFRYQSAQVIVTDPTGEQTAIPPAASSIGEHR